MLNTQLLYSNLMALCQPEDSPFYYVDHKLGDNHYRVFTYRLAQYSDFLKESALECRGHMFKINADGTVIRLASLPMTKFFNYNENPFTIGLDLSEGADLIMTKEDGSLISSYFNEIEEEEYELRLKSKTALESEQANAAMAYLEQNPALQQFVTTATMNNYTVNMEFLSPHYRIVVPHQEEFLTVLNMRNNVTGEYMSYDSLFAIMQYWKCEQHLVQNHLVDDLQTFIDSVPELNNGMEGYVVRLKDGTMFKVKTNVYKNLHALKSSIDSPRNLFELVVNEGHDDFRASFPDDVYMLGKIDAMEKIVADLYVQIKNNVVKFYNENKELDRKSYAIKAKNEVPQLFFGLAMSIYLGKDLNEKEFLIKHYKDFGIKDESLTLDV